MHTDVERALREQAAWRAAREESRRVIERRLAQRRLREYLRDLRALADAREAIGLTREV